MYVFGIWAIVEGPHTKMPSATGLDCVSSASGCDDSDPVMIGNVGSKSPCSFMMLFMFTYFGLSLRWRRDWKSWQGFHINLLCLVKSRGRPCQNCWSSHITQYSGNNGYCNGCRLYVHMQVQYPFTKGNSYSKRINYYPCPKMWPKLWSRRTVDLTATCSLVQTWFRHISQWSTKIKHVGLSKYKIIPLLIAQMNDVPPSNPTSNYARLGQC